MSATGLHHVTAITGDASANIDFYARLLGLRLVKKTVNFDAPDVYHLYYGDEQGSPGSLVTFFEFPGAAPGRAGAGMVHRLVWRVADEAGLDFWAARLRDAGVLADRAPEGLSFSDPEGLQNCIVVAGRDRPAGAESPDVPPEHALGGLQGVHAFASDPEAGRALVEGLGLTPVGEWRWRAGVPPAAAELRYQRPPTSAPVPGAGSVHHVAWAVDDDAALEALRKKAAGLGARPTPIIDRQYFHSVYFREPSGVLFELATSGPGFAIDEPPEALGESLVLPARYEALRPELERRLTPLVNPRSAGVRPG